MRGRESRVLNPSPDPVTLVTLIKLQNATKQRNKDEIKVHNGEAGEGSSQSRFLPGGSSFIISPSLGNTSVFHNL